MRFIAALLFGFCAAAQAAGTITIVDPNQVNGMKVNSDGSINANTTGGGGTVTTIPQAVTPTDRGGTITVGGTAQNAASANSSRSGGWIQNSCAATEDLYVSTTTTATVGGAGNDADLPPCGSFSLIQSGLIIRSAVSVNAATTGHRWLSKETQ